MIFLHTFCVKRRVLYASSPSFRFFLSFDQSFCCFSFRWIFKKILLRVATKKTGFSSSFPAQCCCSGAFAGRPASEEAHPSRSISLSFPLFARRQKTRRLLRGAALQTSAFAEAGGKRERERRDMSSLPVSSRVTPNLP